MIETWSKFDQNRSSKADHKLIKFGQNLIKIFAPLEINLRLFSSFSLILNLNKNSKPKTWLNFESKISFLVKTVAIQGWTKLTKMAFLANLAHFKPILAKMANFGATVCWKFFGQKWVKFDAQLLKLYARFRTCLVNAVLSRQL